MAKQEKESTGQVIIKKYSNRRLYDSTNKRYVTLEDISELIREGSEVKVIDSQSGADIYATSPWHLATGAMSAPCLPFRWR